jgi:hypothetical protein
LIERAPIVPGQMVSLDAMHTQHQTVAQILYDKGTDYPWWREWNAGHRWHMIRQVTQPP